MPLLLLLVTGYVFCPLLFPFGTYMAGLASVYYLRLQETEAVFSDGGSCGQGYGENENKNNDVGFPFRSSCVYIMKQSGRTANDAGNTMSTKCHIITISLICHRNLHMTTLDPFPARGSF